MSDKKQDDKVVFNNDIYERKKEPNYSDRERIIWIKYPALRLWGILTTFIGLFGVGISYGCFLYSGLRVHSYFILIFSFIIILSFVMDYYGSDVYYKVEREE